MPLAFLLLRIIRTSLSLTGFFAAFLAPPCNVHCCFLPPSNEPPSPFLTCSLTSLASMMKNKLPPEKNRHATRSSPVPPREVFHCSPAIPDVEATSFSPSEEHKEECTSLSLSSLVYRRAAKIPLPPGKIVKQKATRSRPSPPTKNKDTHSQPPSQDREAYNRRLILPN